MHRRPLTIELRRDGTKLLRRYHLPVSGLFQGEAPGPQALAEIGLGYESSGLKGLEALGKALSSEAPEALDLHLGGARLDRAGELLFELLFGPEASHWMPVIQRAFALPDEVPTPIRQPVRIRILNDLPELDGLPWRLAQWNGYLLADWGWTFEIVRQVKSTLRPDHRSPGRILVLAPPESSSLGGPAPRSIEVEPHVRDLRALLDNLSPGFPDSGNLEVARARDGAERALRDFGADFVYFYGHGAMQQGKPQLRLGDGTEDWMLMRDLVDLLRSRPPRAVFLNGCWTGQGGWHAAGHQLLSLVPLVIANATVVNAATARHYALEWIESWLGRGQEPVVAAHARPKETKSFSQWAPALVYADYDTFETSRPANARVRLDRVEDWLDRDKQRAVASKHVEDLVGRDRQRVEAIIAYGKPGNSLDRVFQQIRDYIESKVGDRIHVLPLRVPFPDPLGQPLRAEHFDHALKAHLGVRPDHPLASTLAARAPLPKGDAARVLWLDWGVLKGRESFDDEVFTWLDYARDHLASAPFEGFRVVASLALEAEGEAFEQLAEGLPELRGDPEFYKDRFRCAAVDPLDGATKADLLDFLEKNGCEPTDLRPLADAIFYTTQGRYDATRQLLIDGLRLGWPVLLGRLAAPTKPRRRFGAERPTSSSR